jgi:membrane protease YdiL (CAAX protease family)
MLQRSLEQRLSVNASTFIECAAFGIVHLCHHGLALGATGVTMRPVSGALWVVLMFFVALMFARIRKRSGSLYPAMAAHAAFNATMNSVIFAFLWK